MRPSKAVAMAMRLTAGEPSGSSVPSAADRSLRTRVFASLRASASTGCSTSFFLSVMNISGARSVNSPIKSKAQWIKKSIRDGPAVTDASSFTFERLDGGV